MTGIEVHTNLLMQDNNAFLYTDDFNGIFQYKDKIDKSINNDNIITLTIIWNSNNTKSNTDQHKKMELYSWIDTLDILTTIVANSHCYGDLLELFMKCDIRLGGEKFSIQFPDDMSKFPFNFEETCQLLMGNERNIEGYKGLLKRTLYCNDIYNMRLINKIVYMDNVLNEVQEYINRLMKYKSNHQIKSIIKCFNNYKYLGLNCNRELLLEQESKQFCSLIIKEYLKKEE